MPENYDWDNYAELADAYLSRDVFLNRAITGKMLADSAKQAYEEQGIFVPVNLALAQLQQEGSLVLRGRSPVNNPFNVGEYDEGTKMEFSSPEEGINAYYNLMAKDYLQGKQPYEILQQGQFVNQEGNRYASDPDYEKKLTNIMEYMTNFWKNREKI